MPNLQDAVIFDHWHLMYVARGAAGAKSHRARPPGPSWRPHKGLAGPAAVRCQRCQPHADRKAWLAP
jgi:hypothetical protein